MLSEKVWELVKMALAATLRATHPAPVAVVRLSGPQASLNGIDPSAFDRTRSARGRATRAGDSLTYPRKLRSSGRRVRGLDDRVLERVECLLRREDPHRDGGFRLPVFVLWPSNAGGEAGNLT